MGIIFNSYGGIGYADGNIMSMNINDQVWIAKDIDQNIVAPIEGHDLYDFYIGGNGASGGFSIRIELDQHQLLNPAGRYPIYSSYPNSKNGQVYLLPNFSDFHYYNEYSASESLDKKMVIGYLVIKSAQLEQSKTEFWYSEMSGTFESQFSGEASNGEAKEITIKDGYFTIQQPEHKGIEVLDEPLVSKLNEMKIRLNDKDWGSDQQNFSVVLSDDQFTYSAVLIGERNGMYKDIENAN